MTGDDLYQILGMIAVATSAAYGIYRIARAIRRLFAGRRRP